MIKFFLLGKVRICQDDRDILEQVPAKGLALLTYLALARRPCARSVLAGLLWGEMPEDGARANLRLTLSRMQKLLGDCLLVSGQNVAFAFSAASWVDVVEFETHAAHPQQATPEQLRAAAALYEGDFLAGFTVREAPDFEQWVLVERERLQRLALTTLTHLATHSHETGDLTASIDWTRRLLTLAPWQEEAHRHLIELLARSGQRAAALAHLDQCRRILADELDVEPAPETVALVARIKRGEVVEQKTRRPEDKKTGRQEEKKTEEQGSGESSQANRFLSPPLPVFLSSLPPLIGREREVAQIEQFLRDPHCRLLTLIGPGGSGKTRLALAAAQNPAFGAGVQMVSLVGVSADPSDAIADRLVVTIANALGITFLPQRPAREQLWEQLQRQVRLLILDNFEHLRAGSGFLAELLAYVPTVQLLVTSRERLGLQAEWVLDVSGLAYPASNGVQVDYPAAQLFAQAAQRLQPDLDLTAEAPAILRICRLVQGMPLAILLAANWVHALSCQQIAERLTRDLDLLATTGNDLDERHRSMRSVWDYSWRLLNAEEQQSLRRLAHFPGDFALTAAEVITGARPAVIASLVDKSLLQRQSADRYLLHELLRQYAAEALARHPEEQEQIEQAYSQYYALFLQARRPSLEERPDRLILAELDRELAHLRAVRDWLLAQGEMAALAELLEALWAYYSLHGWFQEAIAIFSQLCHHPVATLFQRARWHQRLGTAYYQGGQFAEGQHHLAQTLALLGQPMPTSRWGYYAAIGAQVVRQVAHRLFPRYWIGKGSQQAELLVERAHAWWQQIAIAYFQGDHLRLLMGTLSALNWEEEAGATRYWARSYATVMFTCALTGQARLAQRYHRLSEAALHQTEAPLLRAYVCTILGTYALTHAQWSMLQARALEAIPIYQHFEQQRSLAEAYSLLYWHHFYQGRPQQYAQFAQRQAELGAAIHDRGVQSWGCFNAAYYELKFVPTRSDHPLAQLTAAQQLLGGGTPPDNVLLYGLLALCHWRRGELAEAWQAAQTALQWIERLQVYAFYVVEGYRATVEVLLMLWEKQFAVATPAHLQQQARRACRHLHRFARINPFAQPCAHLASGWYAWLNGQPAKAHQAWQQSLNLATTLQMPYEQGRAHYEIGRHLPVAAAERERHLQQARAIFAQMGAMVDLAMVEEIEDNASTQVKK